MHHEISARGSLLPVGDGSALLSDTLSPTRQWGREKSPHPPSSGSAANAPASPADMSELTLTDSEVQSVLEALHVMEATGSNKIPAKLLKETASVIAPSLVSLLKSHLAMVLSRRTGRNLTLFQFLKGWGRVHRELQAHLLTVTGKSWSYVYLSLQR